MSYLLLGIELNNFAVEELQNGDVSKAFELLKYSYDYILKSDHYPQGSKNKQRNSRKKRSSNSTSYSSTTKSKKQKHDNTNNSNDDAIMMEEEEKKEEQQQNGSSSSSSSSSSSDERSYNLKWNDCTVPVTGVMNGNNKKRASPHGTAAYYSKSSSAAENSSLPFLCLKLLTVDMKGRARETIEEVTCSCEFEWVVWYNTGIVSTIMANLNQRMDATKRQELLEQALWMFERADLILKERRVPESANEKPSKDWSLVRLSLLNNQACVLKDLCVDDQVIIQRLLDMGLTLTTSLPILDTPDQQSFLWTINYLVQDVYALAA